jgi:hypothetical protein
MMSGLIRAKESDFGQTEWMTFRETDLAGRFGTTLTIPLYELVV